MNVREYAKSGLCFARARGDIDTVDGDVAPKAASILVRAENTPTLQAHITSFDQRIVVGEQHLGDPLKPSASPGSRFYRLVLNDGQLSMSRLKLEALTGLADGPEVQIVPQDGLDAVQYDDILAMAATMVQLLEQDEVWEDEQLFARGDTP